MKGGWAAAKAVKGVVMDGDRGEMVADGKEMGGCLCGETGE